MKFKAVCPECEYEFYIDDPEVNEIIVCPDCKLNLMIMSVNTVNKTVELELTETYADDWGE
ncbi:MAG: lysine biosynthesis protein LysW [Bacteroidota bacterium]